MNNDTIIAPDMAQTRAFLSKIGPTNATCFQTFGEGQQKNHHQLARTIHSPFVKCQTELSDLNNNGAGVFFTVNAVIPGKPRTAENVMRVCAAFADNDKPEQRGLIEGKIAQCGLAPSIIVESSPGKHHYYFLVNDCPLSAFTPLQAAIAAELGTDPVVKDLPRVMRLPGFIHRKGKPFLVRELPTLSVGAVYTYAQLAAAFPPAATHWTSIVPNQKYSSGKISSGVVTTSGAAGTRWREHLSRHGGLMTLAARSAFAATSRGERHAMVLVCVASLVRLGWANSEIRDFVLTTARTAKAWSDVKPAELSQRVYNIAEWVRGQEAAKLASGVGSSSAMGSPSVRA